ncbi:acyl-CoA dehydratase activase-related protein [bacterium]|nr:acyl-CoA dehydratase activase-related protein [bacterium]
MGKAVNTSILNPVSRSSLPIGIDIGSTTAKIVILDNQHKTLFSQYKRHNASVDETLINILNEAYGKLGNAPLSAAVTGSAGMGVSESTNLPFIQEAVALVNAVEEFYPDTTTLLDIGGEDSKMVFLSDRLRPDIRMNGNCAGGTGAFIDQMAALMDISLEELEELAESSNSVLPIASRCGVFAKTDVQNLLSKHVPKSVIASSIYHAVAIQTLSTLSRGQEITPKMLFAGGPLCYFKCLRKSILKVSGMNKEDSVLPDNPQLVPAIGAAISNDMKRLQISIPDLIKIVEQRNNNHNSVVNIRSDLRPLFKDDQHFTEWEKAKSSFHVNKIQLQNLDGRDVFLGMDSGSTTTKIVLIDDDGNVAFQYYNSNHGNPIAAVQKGLKQLKKELKSAKTNVNIRWTGVTGYGEDLIHAAFGIDEGIVETLAHYRGACSFNKDVSFILDIGGQDMKAIFIRNGVINRIEINEACSSGCGSFIETFASTLGYEVSEFARIACKSEHPADLGTRCTVFMNSKVKQSLREGAPLADISAGLAYSVIKNCFNKVLKIHDQDVWGDYIIAQGGTFRNQAVLRAMEILLDRKIIRPDICEQMGAYGTALTARDRYYTQTDRNSTFIGLEDTERVEKCEKREIRCKGCENQCSVTRMLFDTGKRFYTGNRCEDVYVNGREIGEKGHNLFTEKNDLLFNRPIAKTDSPIAVIGIPRALNMYENFPFWNTLFVECGFQVKLSPISTTELDEKGSGTVMSENICFPARLVHGHIKSLIESGVDRIFYPLVVLEKGDFEAAVNTYNCPIVTGYPDVIRSAFNFDKRDIPLDTPVVVFSKDKLLRRSCLEYFSKLDISGKVFERAFKLALTAQLEFKNNLKSRATEILAEARQNNRLVILLAGRPYHLDPLINHKIPDTIASFGVDVITDDAVPAMQEDMKELQVLSQWEYSNRLYNAANWVGRQPDVQMVQLNSFGCGPDALTVDEVRDILKQFDKSHTLLRIDDITSTGSVKLRIRSMIESLRMDSNTNSGQKTGINKHKRKTTPLYQASDRRKPILAPNFSPFYSLFFKALYEPLGYSFEVLPPSDRESVEIGLKYTNNDICYPAIICIGDIIKALKSGKYDPGEVVAGISETGGQCRASNYVSLLKKALINAGFDNVPVITVTTRKKAMNPQPGFKIDHKKQLMIGLSIILFIDQIVKLYQAVAVREIKRGSAQKLVDKYLIKAEKAIKGYSVKDAEQMLKQAVKEFNRIETREDEFQRVGIVGEIFVKYNPFANNDVVNWLMKHDIEVYLPPLLPFFLESLVDADVNHRDNVREMTFLNRSVLNLFEKYIDGQIETSNNIMSEFKHKILPVHNIRDLAKLAEPLLHLVNQYGEGWLLPAEVAAMVKAGINNVICLQPFACIANHVVAKGLSKRLKDVYSNLNMLLLDMDSGSSEVNLQNRLEFLVRSIKGDNIDLKYVNEESFDVQECSLCAKV